MRSVLQGKPFQQGQTSRERRIWKEIVSESRRVSSTFNRDTARRSDDTHDESLARKFDTVPNSGHRSWRSCCRSQSNRSISSSPPRFSSNLSLFYFLFLKMLLVHAPKEIPPGPPAQEKCSATLVFSKRHGSFEYNPRKSKEKHDSGFLFLF